MATVKLSRDLLEAHLVLGPDERLSPVEAMALLHRRGVVFGILVDAVMQLASQIGPLELKVAQGEPPVHGQDATVEYLFRRLISVHQFPVRFFNPNMASFVKTYRAAKRSRRPSARLHRPASEWCGAPPER